MEAAEGAGPELDYMTVRVKRDGIVSKYIRSVHNIVS